MLSFKSHMCFKYIGGQSNERNVFSLCRALIWALIN